ncbi:hypothetical protein BDQ17DRAFT_817820 [Cyathus striatus]|nr:hypothetical protein BDQ17DRAFT_817820 [Cyathus striatus]
MSMLSLKVLMGRLSVEGGFRGGSGLLCVVGCLGFLGSKLLEAVRKKVQLERRMLILSGSLCFLLPPSHRSPSTTQNAPPYRSRTKDYHEILPKSFKGDFTHVVRVSQAAKCDSWTESDDISSIQILNLTTPTTTPPCGPISKDQEGTTQLTISQLQIARDFLSLSLPYFSLSNPPSPSIPQYSSTSQAKVLIVAPKHVDALSIVVAYLAFCSGEHVFTVIQYIDEDRGVPRGWRGVFPVDSMLSVGREMWYGEGAEKVEWAARLDG